MFNFMLEDYTVVTSLAKEMYKITSPWKVMTGFLPPLKGTNSSTDYCSEG